MNLNTKGINVNTVSVTDFEMVAAKLARVVVAYTGKHTMDSISAELSKQLKYAAAPVEASFRKVKEGVLIGFVRANIAVRVVEDEQELRANYRVMSSNIMMDNSDKTLWDLKQGKGGTYLARHGNEDLSELVSLAASHRSDVPNLRKITTAKASRGEFVAFASASGDMDYGFCTRTGDDRLQVVSVSQGKAVTIPHEVVAQVSQVKILKSDHERLVKAGLTREQKDKEIEYYARLYSYSPQFVADIKEQIEESATI